MGMPFLVLPSSVFLSSVSLSSVIPGPQGGTRKVDALEDSSGLDSSAWGSPGLGTSMRGLPDSLRAPE
jgi:hypothetical protein